MITFTKERLILCEGSLDKTFFDELIVARNLPDFEVRFPHKANETTGGIDKFGGFLFGNINENFLQTVRGVLVVADNDADPAENFNKVAAQIEQAGYGVPDRELQFVLSPDPLPPIAIMMLPLNGQAGTLETVCKRAGFERWPELETPLEAYRNIAPARDWEQGKQDKMIVQCIIAATCRSNPYATISTLYREPTEYHFPLDAACFDDIARVLADFDAMAAAAT